MNKDVIYIDVDDDVTAIIGKIKKSKEKIVAIVPPKRAGALQSAVNLRLLDRMAKSEKKNLVIVTSNQALVALAAAAKIPVAKNLQSKPEIAEIPALAVDDDDDIIDGSELPVGDHAKTVKVKDGTKSSKAVASNTRSDAIDSVDIEDEEDTVVAAAASVPARKAASSASRGSKVKIPNFDQFRKRMFLGIGGAVALVALLIWMFVFAPAATVIITAKTSPSSVSTGVTLSEDEGPDFGNNLLRIIAQEEEVDETVEFEATGEKDLGNAAKGTVEFSTNNISNLGTTIPKGTTLTTSSGLQFTTDAPVTITISNYNGAPVGITASAKGTDYNGATGMMSGAPSGIATTITETTSGGTTKIAKVVSASDYERARGELVGRSTDKQREALMEKFANGEKVIEGSFTVKRDKVVSSPGVDQEAADGKAKLTVATKYTLYAVSKADLDNYLNEALKRQIDENSQQIYGTGIDDATLSGFRKEDKKLTAIITATGSVGPKIDEAAIKEKVRGKIYGEVQSSLQATEGIRDVDVQFSFFWVRSVPNDINKIRIEFEVENE